MLPLPLAVRGIGQAQPEPHLQLRKVRGKPSSYRRGILVGSRAPGDGLAAASLKHLRLRPLRGFIGRDRDAPARARRQISADAGRPARSNALGERGAASEPQGAGRVLRRQLEQEPGLPLDDAEGGNAVDSEEADLRGAVHADGVDGDADQRAADAEVQGAALTVAVEPPLGDQGVGSDEAAEIVADELLQVLADASVHVSVAEGDGREVRRVQ